MKGKGSDSEIRGYIGNLPSDTSGGGGGPRWPVGPKKLKGESYMSAKGESAATSLKAAQRPTYWRRGGFVTPHAAGGGWIKGAIKHPGALKASASKAGESTHEFAESHKHDSGKTGNRARLALTLGKLRGK